MLNNLDQYFSNESVVGRVQKKFKNICSYDCYDPRPLHDFWSKIPDVGKYRQGLYVHLADEFYEVLQRDFEKKKEINKKEKEKRNKLILEKEEFDKNKNKKTKEEYEEIKKKFDNLCKPKDRWKTGRVMLGLKKKYKFDSILKKMIKNEFKENRRFKYI